MRPTDRTYQALTRAGLIVTGGMLRCGDMRWQHGRVVKLNTAKTAPKSDYVNASSLQQAGARV